MRQVSGRIHARLEERLNERERIAREIHDTLLQGIYALTARLHAAIQRMPRSDSARAAIEQALDRADVVLAEGRDRVTGLRASTEAPSTLAAEIGAIARQFEETQGHPVVFEVRVEGDERTLHLAVREEIVQIAREALANTYRHAQARSVVVELIYGRGVLRMKVRDDGEGFDTSALAEAPGANHWGVVGMRERARKLRGHLDIWSRRGEGTEITLSIPGRVAYGRRQLR
jgi:signal transduction histidine kinase